MDLTYRQKMGLTAAFLQEMRLRLSDKNVDVLPPDGKLYDGIEPSRLSLVGCLGPAPDPNYTGPQPPNSIGIVLLVSPDSEGAIKCELGGQFDVVHRYIPDLRSMEENLVLEEGSPKKGQSLAVAFKRYTVSFTSITLELDPARPNEWVSAKADLSATLADEQQRWLSDPRVMRRCRTNVNGKARFNFDWSETALVDQLGLNRTVHEQIISDRTAILNYGVNLRGRLRPTPSAFGTSAAGSFLLEVFLENQTTTEHAQAFGVDSPYLLDARLVLKLIAGQSHKVPHRLQPEEYRYRDDDGLPGYGISCAVLEVDKNQFMTDGMPTFAQPRVEAPSPADMKMEYAPAMNCLRKTPCCCATVF
ncbi:hypothetical protein QJS63_21210 [Pseudomonas juntendi]|nr:hypothetical protein QJS63_21210 [Pseudomonas juntendi]